ncbi:MAG: hypothetical protein M3299_10985 [Thermoproteota archaeon]|nr:hypothetical protein [Thermoproteota archaeon]
MKKYAVFYPLLFLVIIPFALAFVLPSLLPDFKVSNIFSPDFYTQFDNKPYEEGIAILISILVTMIPSYFFAILYFLRFGAFGTKKLLKRENSRILINLYEVLNRILFGEIAVFIAITVIFYSIPESHTWPLLGKGFYFMQITLVSTIYVTFVYLFRSYLRRDFRFILAQKCMDVANEEVDQATKINYLKAGLSSYNKYLKRNFDLQFDDTRVASNIISSSSDKNQIVKTIEKSFSEDSLDKLKPSSCLSTFANLDSKEQFLIGKQLSTRIIEIGTFLAAIIPVLITVIQLAFP